MYVNIITASTRARDLLNSLCFCDAFLRSLNIAQYDMCCPLGNEYFLCVALHVLMIEELKK